MRDREAGVEYFARPVSAREKELEERVEDVTLKGEVRDFELEFGGISAGLGVTELLGDFGQALAALQRELEQEREEVRLNILRSLTQDLAET